MSVSAVRIPASADGRAGVAHVRTLLASRPRDESLSVEARRAALAAFAEPRGRDLPVTPGEVAGVPVEWHPASPKDASAGAVIYAHGGAYVIGSVVTHRALAARLAQAAGAAVCAVDYRLAPEHPWPAGRDDLTAVAEALAERGPFALAGDSAGGGLCLAAALALRDAGARLPVAVGCTSPWSDLTLTAASLTERAAVEPILSPEGLRLDAGRYLAGADARAASPLFADLAGLPPVLIQVGEDEVLHDDAFALADALDAAAVPVRLELWEGMIHSWHAFGEMVPEADAAMRAWGAFLGGALRAAEHAA